MGKETMICQDFRASNYSNDIEIFYGEGPDPPPPSPTPKISNSIEMFGALESWQIIVQWLVFFEKNHRSPQQNKLRTKNTTPTSKKFSEILLLSVWPGGLPPPSTHTRARAQDENSLIRTWNKSEGSFYAPCLWKDVVLAHYLHLFSVTYDGGIDK